MVWIQYGLMFYYLRPNMIFLLDKMFRIKTKNNILKTKFAM